MHPLTMRLSYEIEVVHESDKKLSAVISAKDTHCKMSRRRMKFPDVPFNSSPCPWGLGRGRGRGRGIQ